MARGYLGKISAVISANTGQFRRGVNEAANDTRNFARMVESNLRRASGDAQKSIRSILTPIQQLRASLQAAGEQGLRFRGFQGAIRNIEDLKQRLTSLSRQDTQVVLRISGAERITDLQLQLREISNRDVQIVTRVGGLEGLQAGVQRLTEAQAELADDRSFQVLQARISGVSTRLSELRENSQVQLSLAGGGGDLAEVRQLRAEYDLLSQSLSELEQERRQFVSRRVGLNIDFSELDEITRRFRGLNADVLPELMQGLGASQFQQAEASMMRLVTVAEGLSKPLSASVEQFQRLDLAVQAGFLPSLSEVQNEVMGLERSARDTADGFEESFNRIERNADDVIAAISQMSELAQSIATLRTGDELSFQQPDLMAAIGRGREFGNRAAPLMEGASPQVREETVQRLRQILALSQDIERQFSALQDARRRGATFVADNIEANIRAQTQEINSLVEQGNIALRITADSGDAVKEVNTLANKIAALREESRFVITGEISAGQVLDTLGQVNRLIERARSNNLSVTAFQGGVDSLFADAEAAAAGDQEALNRFRQAYDTLRENVEEGINLQVRGKRAQEELDRLTLSLEKLRQDAAFVITGRTQNIEQVKSELQKVLASIGKLKDDARGDLQVQVDAVINAIDANDFDEARNAVEQLRASAGNAITLDADTKAAEEKTKKLQASIDAVRQRVEFSITGNPQTFEQAKQQFNTIFADFEKLSEASKRSIAVDITRVGELIEEGQEGELANIVALLQRVKAGVDGLKGNAINLDFGKDLDDPRRQLEVLKGSVVSLKGQLDTLPAGIRAQFIPAIKQAEANLDALARSPTATADQLENARNELDRLNRSYRQISQVQAIPNFAEAFEGSALRGAIGNLQAFQQIIARVGAEAGSKAAVQFDRMRAAVLRAANDGTLGTRAFAQELKRLTNEAADAAAATGRIGRGAAFREIQRGGDIARGGFNNLSLAVQQAAFAIDDFFSVQGDFTQRLRAVQNNVTQLAFIIGGTRGLFIGLGVAIAAQATVALINWINNGRTAEDQTKALNDALARQKSLVEELAQAFESLGDSIARRAFSDSAQEARAFRKELDDIAKKQRELNEARVADLDVDVQRERAQQNQIRRDLESATDPGRRVILQRQLQESRAREEEAARAAAARTVSGDEVAEAVFRAVVARTPTGNQRLEFEQRAREAAAAVPRGAGPEAVLEQRRAIQSQLDALASQPASARRDAAAAELERLLQSLELPLQNALNELSRNIIQSSLGAALAIEQAQNDVADAIQRGVAGAADFQAALDNTARQLDEEERRLADAQNIRDPAERERQIRIAEGNIRDIRNIRNRQDVINEQSRELRLTTGRGGERTTAALSALQGNERFANEYGRLTARLRDAADREFAARNDLAQATAEGDEAAKARARAELDAANAASDLAAAAAEAALAMEKALSRIRKIADDALSASTSIADDAQRQFTQDPTEANRRERDAAEQQLIRDRERVARANNALDRRRSELSSGGDQRLTAIAEEIRQIEEERKRIGDKSAQDRTQEDARRAEELANRQARLEAEREERLRNLTAAEQREIDAINQEIAARQKMIEAMERQRAFDQEVENRRNPRGDALRGLDLVETQGQRAARQAAQGVADIDAAFQEFGRRIVDQAGGLSQLNPAAQAAKAELAANDAARQEAVRRFAADQQRAAAPAIFNLADSVENAILQGPSRAALNASDISTQEGARELNRLLRGDDPARDQNLVELQKQSQELQLVNQRLTEIGRQVGVAL